MRYLLIPALFILSSCVVRDNPLDVKGDSYEKPAITATSGIPATGVLLGGQLKYSAASSSESSAFRCKLDEGGWSQWSKSEYTTAVTDGFHTLYTELCYPSMVDTAREAISFASLSAEKSLYFHSSNSVTGKTNVTLASYLLDKEVVTVHVELGKGVISSASMAGDTSFTKVMPEGNTCEIMLFPGATALTGSVNIASFEIDSVQVGDTISFSAHIGYKDGDTATVNTTLGTIVQ